MQTTNSSAPRSVRFWHSGRNNLGVIMAILAAMVTFSGLAWPSIVPQGHGDYGALWMIAVGLIAAGYLVAFFLADRYWKRARAILFLGAALQIAVGLIAGWAYGEVTDLGGAMLAALFDIAPAILAIIGGLLIGAGGPRSDPGGSTGGPRSSPEGSAQPAAAR